MRAAPGQGHHRSSLLLTLVQLVFIKYTSQINCLCLNLQMVVFEVFVQFYSFLRSGFANLYLAIVKKFLSGFVLKERN